MTKNTSSYILLSSLTIANLKEVLIGKIYDLSDYKKLIKFPFLFKILKKEKLINSSKLGKIIKDLDSENNKNKLGFFTINKTFDSSLFFEKNNLKDINIFNTFDSKLIEGSIKVIFIVEKGSLKRKDIDLYNEYYEILNKNIIGWIFVE